MAPFVPVLKQSELSAGHVRIVDVQGWRLALCNVGGTVYAVEDRCSHDDGPLGEGTLDGGEIECPRHGARFDVKTGEVTCPPAYTAVRTFPVRLQGDEIQVAVEPR